MKLKKLMNRIRHDVSVKVIGLWIYDTYGDRNFGETLFERDAGEFFDCDEVSAGFERIADLKVQNIYLDCDKGAIIVEVQR